MAANFHDALKAALDAGVAGGNGFPPYWFGVADDGAMKKPPYAVIGQLVEDPNYGSAGLVEYMRATATVTVFGLTADSVRAAAALVRAALGPSSLTIDGKACRLYQGRYAEDKTGDRGPQGEFIFSAAIPLDAEIS